MPWLHRVIWTRDVTFDESQGFNLKDITTTEAAEITKTIRLIALQELDINDDIETTFQPITDSTEITTDITTNLTDLTDLTD